MFQLPPVYFEHLLASSLDIVIAVDNEGQIIFYNDGAYRTLGYTLAEIRGKHVTTVYPNIEEARRVMAAMRGKEFGETGQVKNFETELVAKNGEHIPVAISGSVIYDEIGHELGSIGFLKDLREIRRRDQLATLGELAVGLAHRINNPLEVIFNNLEVLSKHLAQVLPDEEHVVEEERIDSIHRELKKFARLSVASTTSPMAASYTTTEYLHGSRMADLGREETILSPLPEEARPTNRALAGLTILVVDDDLGVCYSLRDLLREEGCEVEVATNGSGGPEGAGTAKS